MYQNNPLDEKIDRKHSDSVKYGAGNRDPEREKLLPLWVADMDFRVPDPVIKALRDRTEHGIFGYDAAEENYYDAVCGWFRTHFHFDVDPRWIVTTPGVVFALSAAIRTFTEKGDAVLINRPVYYPFSNLIDGLKRRLINSPLQLKDGRYEIDFADVEEKIVSSGVRLYLLCSPHNPVGRVWTREELKKTGGYLSETRCSHRSGRDSLRLCLVRPPSYGIRIPGRTVPQTLYPVHRTEQDI